MMKSFYNSPLDPCFISSALMKLFFYLCALQSYFWNKDLILPMCCIKPSREHLHLWQTQPFLVCSKATISGSLSVPKCHCCPFPPWTTLPFLLVWEIKTKCKRIMATRPWTMLEQIKGRAHGKWEEGRKMVNLHSFCVKTCWLMF